MPSELVVHVIDDDEAARDSLRFLLESAQFTVRSYDSAARFLHQMPDAEPGCIVTDVRMPEISGIDLLKRLNATSSPLPVIVITGHGDIPLAVEAMKQGAQEFFEKPYDDEALLTAVRQALARSADESKQGSAKAEVVERIEALSPRERQVLDGLVAGQPNKTIAFDLGISPRTIEIYRANVMTKMQARSLSELVRMVLLAGVLNKPGDRAP